MSKKKKSTHNFSIIAEEDCRKIFKTNSRKFENTVKEFTKFINRKWGISYKEFKKWLNDKKK